MLEEKAEFPVSLMARVLEVSRSGFYSRRRARLPARRLGRRDARVAGVRPEVRIQVRARDAAAGILPPDRLPSPEIDARAGNTRLHAQREEAHHDPRSEGQAAPRPGAPRLHEPRAHLQARGRHRVPAHRRGVALPGHRHRPVHRMVVGWSLSHRMTADIAVAALESAKSRGYVAGNAIFHSDRGAQYTSRTLAEWASANDVRLSCSRTGNCHDNAVAESFFATPKNEMHYRRSFATRADAKHAVIEFIEADYNRERPHSTIGYQIPAQAMESFFERTKPAEEGLPVAA